jgi:hypothetical protein
MAFGVKLGVGSFFIAKDHIANDKILYESTSLVFDKYFGFQTETHYAGFIKTIPFFIKTVMRKWNKINFSLTNEWYAKTLTPSVAGGTTTISGLKQEHEFFIKVVPKH